MGEDEDLEILSQEQGTILLSKPEDKSEAFPLNQGAKSRILAWAWVNNYYMTISGMGVSNRMGKVMNPEQSKKDEDVVFDVEKWLDEIRELVSLGQEDLPAGFRFQD